jgi:hypothetical protein
MPFRAVADDILCRRLVTLAIKGEPGASTMPMSAIYRDDELSGQAGRRLINRLKSQRTGKL